MYVLTCNFFVPISRLGNGNECATKDRVTGKAGVPQNFSRTQGTIVIASKIVAVRNTTNQCTIWSRAERKWNEDTISAGITTRGEAKTQYGPQEKST